MNGYNSKLIFGYNILCVSGILPGFTHPMDKETNMFDECCGEETELFGNKEEFVAYTIEDSELICENLGLQELDEIFNNGTPTHYKSAKDIRKSIVDKLRCKKK